MNSPLRGGRWVGVTRRKMAGKERLEGTGWCPNKPGRGKIKEMVPATWHRANSLGVVNETQEGKETASAFAGIFCGKGLAGQGMAGRKPSGRKGWPGRRGWTG